MNHEIRAREVRLINQDNQQVGVVPIQEAIRMAQEAELDLVEVAADAKPPVCKIVDYKKVIYEQKRRARDSRKRQKSIEIKEVKMRPSIDKHDYETKITHAREFLTDGDKVKVTFIYKGREQVHQARATKLMEQILADLGELAVVENVARMGPKLTALILSKKR